MWVVLADTVLVLHLTYLAFVPLGGLFVLRWPRVVWVHLVAVAVAVVSITVRFDCPLTTWEQSLRRRGGSARTPMASSTITSRAASIRTATTGPCRSSSESASWVRTRWSFGAGAGRVGS